MLTRRPRGTRDLLPDDVVRWRHLERAARDLCCRWGYGEIRTPLFEHTELFQRGVGEGTDIVDKEMYSFADRGGRSLTLRPESTAPVIRACLEEGLFNRPLPVKLFYVSFPCFRYERPQAARYRQHHQFGVEVVGSPDPMVDVEVISLAGEYLETLGLSGLDLKLNSIGCPLCRDGYRRQLVTYLTQTEGLCQACAGRLQRNPLRILDCKEAACREIAAQGPMLMDHLCEACRLHLAQVRAGLERLKLPYQLDPMLVRGLDYYTHTVFEIYRRDAGSHEGQLCGGGRYDGLAAALGGPDTPGMGFGMGMERLLLALEQAGEAPAAGAPLDIFLATTGHQARDRRLLLLRDLRRAGMSADTDFMDRSLRAQLRLADRMGARLALIVGDDELASGQAVVRDLRSGRQTPLPLDSLGTQAKPLLSDDDGEDGARR